MFACSNFSSIIVNYPDTYSTGALDGGFATINNPLATNGAYFMDPSGSPVLRALVGSFDIITIWTLVLVAIGIPCIARVKKGTAFGIVIAWFAFTVLLKVGLAAL